MNTLERINRWEPTPLQIIILLALLQLLVTLLSNGFVLSFDEAMWHYIGRNWFRHGLAPYAGGVDNKSPVIFAIFGLSDTLFGVNYWFPRLLGTIWQSVGIYYVYKIAKQVAGHRAGMLAVSFYGLALLWHATGGEYVSYTETYEVTFIIISFYKFITAQNKRDYIISGFVAAIGFGFRVSAIFGIITLFTALFRKSRSSVLPFCLGILSGTALLLIIALLAGINLHQLFTYTLADNFGAGSATDHTLMWKLENLTNKFFYSGLLLFYPLVLVYVFIKKNADLFVLWLIWAFIGINVVGIYDRVHLKELLPAFSLMSAFAVAYLIDRFAISTAKVFVVIWVIFFPKSWEPLVNLKKVLWKETDATSQNCKPPYIIPNEGDRKKLGWWIKANAAEGEKVFVAGYGAQVQVYSERLSPSIYFNVTQTKIAKEQLYKDLQINKPGMILVPLFADYEQSVGQDLRLFINHLVARNYYLDRCLYSYNIYKIRK